MKDIQDFPGEIDAACRCQSDDDPGCIVCRMADQLQALQAKVEELEEENARVKATEYWSDGWEKAKKLERRLGIEVLRADNNFNRVEVLEKQLHEPGYVDELRAILEEAGTVLHGLGLPTEPFGEGPSLSDQIGVLGAEVAGLRGLLKTILESATEHSCGCRWCGDNVVTDDGTEREHGCWHVKAEAALAPARETEGE